MISLDRTYKLLVVFALILLGLYLGRTLLAPIALSILLAIVILPIANWFEKIKFNRFFSTLISLLLSMSIGLFVGYYCFAQLTELTLEMPNLEASVFEKLNRLISFVPEEVRPKTVRDFEDIKAAMPKDNTWFQNFFGNFIAATGEVLTLLFLLPIYVFFILFYRRRLLNFINELDLNTEIELSSVTKQSQGVVQKYLSGMGLVILLIAIMASAGLWLMDIPYALLLGIISAILTIIPYVGTFIGAIIPIMLALVLKDSIWYPIGVAVMFAAIQLLENNFITPVVVGRSVNINPLAAIVVLIFAGQIWGFVGLIIAIPIAGMLEIVLEHIPEAKHWSVLIRND